MNLLLAIGESAKVVHLHGAYRSNLVVLMIVCRSEEITRSQASHLHHVSGFSCGSLAITLNQNFLLQTAEAGSYCQAEHQQQDGRLHRDDVAQGPSHQQ